MINSIFSSLMRQIFYLRTSHPYTFLFFPSSIPTTHCGRKSKEDPNKENDNRNNRPYSSSNVSSFYFDSTEEMMFVWRIRWDIECFFWCEWLLIETLRDWLSFHREILNSLYSFIYSYKILIMLTIIISNGWNSN